ncbi:hypothetical protein VTN77DRAFT_8125 [Rasamsonia byssochlamydoides]|uniref:uncharacterized protein n=1 Tax=Rasamsonia byssochlamydoides TaxID=89139 RepID=UPI0037420E4D
MPLGFPNFRTVPPTCNTPCQCSGCSSKESKTTQTADPHPGLDLDRSSCLLFSSSRRQHQQDEQTLEEKKVDSSSSLRTSMISSSSTITMTETDTADERHLSMKAETSGSGCSETEYESESESTLTLTGPIDTYNENINDNGERNSDLQFAKKQKKNTNTAADHVDDTGTSQQKESSFRATLRTIGNGEYCTALHCIYMHVVHDE